MGASNGSCLPPDQIERIAAGEPTPADFAAHVGSCAACADRLNAAREEASFVERVRALARAGPEGAPRLPGYRPTGVISAGAQGVVYRAIQESTSRPVAIKTLFSGRVISARQRMRAEREAEIAARLRHPNIVTVFESRTLSDGRTAVVMEFVDGVSLDVWKAPGATAAERERELLRVFIAICAGIHHAHLNGVIHRDLKPDNILVTAEGRPVILDFGIAKMGGIGTTLTGEFAGTPAYASPEQVIGKPDEVDALTDVYSLGVILYRVLCGTLPYEVGGSIFDIAQTIRDVEPTPPRQRCPQLAADLEAILLRVLSKDKTRRYQSAASFARDLERFLAGDPVDARSGSGWYLLRKAVQMNRRRLGWAAAAAALVVVAGGAVVLSLARAAESSRQARVWDEQARAEGVRARAMTEFLREALPETSLASAQGAGGAAPGLDRLYFRLETGGFADDPLVDQSIRRLWGSVYTSFSSGNSASLIAFAEDSLRHSLVRQRLQHWQDAAEDPEIAATMHQLAAVLLVRQRLTEAESLCRQALAMRIKLLGGRDSAVADTRALLARILISAGRPDEARSEADTALASFRVLPDREGDLRIASVLALQARMDLDASRVDDAEPLVREALVRRLRRLHSSDPDLLTSVADAADFAGARPNSDLARALIPAWGSSAESIAADVRRDVPILGSPEAPVTGQGERKSRTAVLQHLVRLDEALLGPSDPGLVDVLTDQMRAAQRDGLLELRAAAALRAADLLSERFGPCDLSAMVCLEEGASVLTYAGHPDHAADLLRRVGTMWDSLPPTARDPLLAASCRRRLAWYLLLAGRPAEALPVYRDSVAALRDAVGQENYIVALAQSGLALCEFEGGEKDAGASLSEHALQVAESPSVGIPTPDDQLAHIRFVRAHILLAQGQPAPARALLEQAWRGFYNVAGPTFPWRATLLADLIAASESVGDAPAAATWREEESRDAKARAALPKPPGQ